MEKMSLGVKFHAREESGTERHIPPFCGPAGIDHVEFMVSPNTGEMMKPLASIASGGELSRIMLAIKALCGSGESGKTLVFDEVDTGIGGRAAEAVGRRLKEISRTHQVLCVTHLPQIAAFAGHHYRVWKDVVEKRTETFVKSMSPKDRLEELARMMDGEVITETSRRHAREMLKRSSRAIGK
jgi:DNA repair protein RecN (Recombination protein N)